MPSLTRTQSSSKSIKSSKSSKSSQTCSTQDPARDSRSTRSRDSYESTSSNATSVASSPRPSTRRPKPSSPAVRAGQPPQQPRTPQQAAADQELSHRYYEDLSPCTNLYPRSSVETYASTNSSQDDDDVDTQRSSSHDEIPPLPLYRHEVVEPNVRPTTPNEFARLFPSMNRLSIRHDEFTSDGNMNLRVDTAVHSGRRRGAAQLFHLRMYDLARREFSLRRYCRDSGREVCNSKRKYTTVAPSSLSKAKDGAAAASDGSCSTYGSPPTERPSLPRTMMPRTMTSAIKTLSSRPQTKRTQSGPAGGGAKRPASRGSCSSSDGEPAFWGSGKKAIASAPAELPTNTIKLEFSNYARVDVERRGKASSDSKRYDFEWWGHRYSWRRTTDKHTGAVSFHLMRDGGSSSGRKRGEAKSMTSAVAHIVPETRSPVQVAEDEEAGGWVPPCHMWISDKSVLEAMTDVADVIVATGLIALVDDCIKARWQTPKIHRIPVPLTSRTVDLEYVGPKAFMRQVFGRKNSGQSTSSSKSTSSSRADNKHGRHDDDDDYVYDVYQHQYSSGSAGHRHAVPAY